MAMMQDVGVKIKEIQQNMRKRIVNIQKNIKDDMVNIQEKNFLTLISTLKTIHKVHLEVVKTS